MERLLRLNEILELIPISKASFYAKLKTGEYPLTPVRLGKNTVAFKASEISHLIENGVNIDGGHNV